MPPSLLLRFFFGGRLCSYGQAGRSDHFGHWCPYLLMANLQNTALSAVLLFSDRVLYRTYGAVPRLFGLSALQDEVAAGGIMWVVGGARLRRSSRGDRDSVSLE